MVQAPPRKSNAAKKGTVPIGLAPEPVFSIGRGLSPFLPGLGPETLKAHGWHRGCGKLLISSNNEWSVLSGKAARSKTALPKQDFRSEVADFRTPAASRSEIRRLESKKGWLTLRTLLPP
jgi:hypothetical protein